MRVSCRVILNNSYLSLLAGVQAFVLSETVICIRIFLIRSVLNIVYIYIFETKKRKEIKLRIKSYPLKITSFYHIRVDTDRVKCDVYLKID